MNERVLRRLLEIPYSNSVSDSKTRERNDKDADHRKYTSK